MTKEEYKKDLKEIEDQLIVLYNKTHALKQSYIESNKQFDIGARIKIISRDGNFRYAHVCENKISFYDDIKIEAYKEKKDGTPSKVKDYIWNCDKVELA